MATSREWAKAKLGADRQRIREARAQLPKVSGAYAYIGLKMRIDAAETKVNAEAQRLGLDAPAVRRR